MTEAETREVEKIQLDLLELRALLLDMHCSVRYLYSAYMALSGGEQVPPSSKLPEYKVH